MDRYRPYMRQSTELRNDRNYSNTDGNCQFRAKVTEKQPVYRMGPHRQQENQVYLSRLHTPPQYSPLSYNIAAQMFAI